MFLKCFMLKHLQKLVKYMLKIGVTCILNHLQNICKNVLEPSTSCGCKNVVKMFYFTCNHLKNVSANVLF